MSYQYRKATESDQESLRQLGLLSFGMHQSVLTPENWAKLHANLQREQTYIQLLSQSTCWVASWEGEVVGMAFYLSSGNPTDMYPADWCYVRMVGVHPDHGGKGIGKALMNLCMDLARETGEKTMGLHTSEFMDAARHIYEQMGFVQVKPLDDRFGKRYWLYRLIL